MRKFVLIAAIALTAAVSLSACNKAPDESQAPAQVQQSPKPTDLNDAKGWNAYLGDLVQKNLQGMTAGQPFAYLVDAADTDTAKANNERQLSNVHDSVARGVLPGNLMAFAGPNSGKTADLLIAAFKDAKPGAFKDVVVLFIGDKADDQRVGDAIKPTGATYHFVAM